MLEVLQMLAAALFALQIDGQNVFQRVETRIENLDADQFYNMPIGIVGLLEETWDGENPTLGTATIFVDVWVSDQTMTAGNLGLTNDIGLVTITDTISENLGVLVPDQYGANLVMISASAPDQLVDGKGRPIWARRLTYRFLKG